MHYVYVCNWKMFIDRHAISTFLEKYVQEKLVLSQNNTLVICPPFCFLEWVNIQRKRNLDSSFKLGAQDCSKFIEGAYTGEISAVYLKDLECQYGIVGHAERRKLFHENDRIVLIKAKNLLANGMTPIICIGFTKDRFSVTDECAYIEKQINFFLRNFDKKDTIIFAYEPCQAIGTNMMPAIHTITEIISIIKMVICKFDFEKKPLIMYGGSVDETSIKILKTIHGIDGFLIGRASIDFQKLKNIISY